MSKKFHLNDAFLKYIGHKIGSLDPDLPEASKIREFIYEKTGFNEIERERFSGDEYRALSLGVGESALWRSRYDNGASTWFLRTFDEKVAIGKRYGMEFSMTTAGGKHHFTVTRVK